MNFFKRAITSITRRLGKTLILLILVFILGNVISGAISIRQAVTNTEINMRRKIGAIATAEMNWDELNKQSDIDWNNIEYIKADAINKIGESQYLKYYDYISMAGLEGDGLKRYKNPESQDSNGIIVRDVVTGYEEEYSYFTLTGGQNIEPMDLKENKITLHLGRFFTEEEMKDGTANKVLITKNLADINGLTVGDTFKLVSKFYKYEGIEAGVGAVDDYVYTPPKPISVKEFEFEIVGIVDTIKEVRPNNQGQVDLSYLDEERENKIYTSNAVVKNINDIVYIENQKIYEGMDYANQEYLQPLFVLNDPADLPAFREVAESILPGHYRIIDNGASFDKVAAPMKNMQWIASIVLYVAIGATLIILSLLITLFLRDRKHEIGIYLSLGEKKIKVICQILAEVVLISVVAITLSLFTGNIVSGVMSEQMLNNQIIAEQEKENDWNSPGWGRDWTMLDSMGYGSNVTSEDLAESYSVSLGFTTVLMFYLVGIATVLVSTLVPIIYIVRLNPKKIMM